MRILIKNCTLISMDEKRDTIEYNQDILIDNDNICQIGKKLPSKNIDKIIQANEKILLPGLINTHAHIGMSIFRETIDGLRLKDWLENKIWPMEDKMTESDMYYASLLSLIEMVHSGCTTVNDMYFYTESTIRAREQIGVRMQTTITFHTIAGEEEGARRFDLLRQLISKYKNHDKTLTFNVGIHGLYTSNEQYIKKCVQLAKELQLPIHMHFCEDENEVQTIIAKYSKNPTQVLIDNFSNIPLILAHCVKINPQDIKKLKNLNLSVSTCPVSNLKLGCGIPPIAKMFSSGINISLGSDGQGSGSNLDLFETMKLTALLQKGIEEDPTLLDAYEILKMATINGAKALCLDDLIGSIQVGKKADIILLDLNTPTTKPTNNLIAQIVYNAKWYNVDTTIINGNILMDHKKLNVSIKENEVIQECEEIKKRISTTN